MSLPPSSSCQSPLGKLNFACTAPLKLQASPTWQYPDTILPVNEPLWDPWKLDALLACVVLRLVLWNNFDKPPRCSSAVVVLVVVIIPFSGSVGAHVAVRNATSAQTQAQLRDL
ncbi:hypothetical protein GGX14DRAFT_385980 [Mycena pura]|uniref:Uncharacterized protein n=1 Tax=Mycena pura TaxID=153505 RepID=A0AAD7E4M3_9AGAR|nr:hypothetical protein GGX14DRAFT_385980 [Mycena pura]